MVIDMDPTWLLTITLGISGSIAAGFNFWISYTKSGKKWLKNLG